MLKLILSRDALHTSHKLDTIIKRFTKKKIITLTSKLKQKKKIRSEQPGVNAQTFTVAKG